MISKKFRDELTTDEWRFMVVSTLVFCVVCAFVPDAFKIGHMSGRLLLGIGGLWSLWALVAGRKPMLLVEGRVERLDAVKRTIQVNASRDDVFDICASHVKRAEDIDLTYMSRESGLISGESAAAKLIVRITQSSQGTTVKVVAKPTRGLLFVTSDSGESYRILKRLVNVLKSYNGLSLGSDNELEISNISRLITLTHTRKVEYCQEDLKKRGMNKLQSAPPLFKLLWKLGIKTPPPVFQSFKANSFMFTSIFSIFYLLQVTPLVALSVVRHEANLGMIVLIAAIMVLVQSLFFGAICAGYLVYKARKMNLPSWDDYDPTASLGVSGLYDRVEIADNEKLAA